MEVNTDWIVAFSLGLDIIGAYFVASSALVLTPTGIVTASGLLLGPTVVPAALQSAKEQCDEAFKIRLGLCLLISGFFGQLLVSAGLIPENVSWNCLNLLIIVSFATSVIAVVCIKHRVDRIRIETGRTFINIYCRNARNEDRYLLVPLGGQDDILIEVSAILPADLDWGNFSDVPAGDRSRTRWLHEYERWYFLRNNS